MPSSQSTGLSGPPDETVVRILECHSLAFGVICLLLVPIQPNHEGIAACEAHVISPRNKTPHRALRFRFGSSDFRLDSGELSLVNICEFAQTWAEGLLEEDILAWMKDQPPGTQYPDPPRFTRSTRTLASMWLASWASSSLKVVKERTGSPELRDYLDRLFRIPPIIVQAIV